MPYNDEGSERDTSIYDINTLRIPIGSSTQTGDFSHFGAGKSSIYAITPAGSRPQIGNEWQLEDVASTPFDTVRVYAYEGTGSLAGSLSSLDSTGNM